MKSKIILFLIIFGWINTAWAQFTPLDVSETQNQLIAQLGMQRMVTKFSTISSTRAPYVSRIQESFFDTLGRITRTTSDICSDCSTVYEYDSLSGLVVYTRVVTQYDVTESFKEYDAKHRPSVIETCNPKDPSCIVSWFEYDEDQTERMYKAESKARLKYDKVNRTRLKQGWETQSELAQESSFNADGQLEETKCFEKGRYHHSLLYQYDNKGRCIKIWSVFNGLKRLYTSVEYNGKGQIIGTQTPYFKGNPILLDYELVPKTYEYDSRGLLLKSITSNSVRQYYYFTK